MRNVEVPFSSLMRSSMRNARLPEPLSNYRPKVTERMHTNPFYGLYSAYPCPYPLDAASQYAKWVGVLPENVLFTPGSVVALDLLIRVFCEPESENIVVTSPTFQVYAQYAEANNVEVNDIRLEGDNYDRLNVDGIVAQKSKLVFLCRPSNPVGTTLSLNEIECLLQECSGLVVVDEAFIEFSNSPSSVTLLSKYSNLVVVRTFSKAWGLAGVRIGAVLADPSIIKSLRILLDPFSCTTVAQAALTKTLGNSENMRIQVNRLQAERTRFNSLLETVPCVVRVFPSEANFLLVQFNNCAPIAATLCAAGDWFSNTSAQIPNTLRISVRGYEENLQLTERLNNLVM